MAKCKFIVKNSSFKMLIVFSHIFVANTKITFVYNFVAAFSKYFEVKVLKIKNDVFLVELL